MQHIKALLTISEKELWHHVMAFSPLCSICKSTVRHGEEFYRGEGVIKEETVPSRVALVGMQVHGYTFLTEARHQTHTRFSVLCCRLTNAATHGRGCFSAPTQKVIHCSGQQNCTMLLSHRHTRLCSFVAVAAPVLQFMGTSNESQRMDCLVKSNQKRPNVH